MLTRLRVSGFKNLVDVDLRFGPFTCVAGANGVGKSNLLDAIAFLSALADKPLIDAALCVRDEEGRTGDVASIFHRVGDRQDAEMNFEAEMIVPKEGTDDLGQSAHASITFLKYKLVLGRREDEGRRTLGGIELLHEELSHVKIGEANQHLKFPHSHDWLKSAVSGQRRTPWFISTDTDKESGARVIRIHQDGGSSGKPRPLLAASLPRTAVSAANAAESPTAMLAKREMQSWRRLQLEPSALRRPDPFTASAKLGADGSHLPATLHDLARIAGAGNHGMEGGAERVYGRLANRLSELIDDVHLIKVDRDEKRELLTLQVCGRDGTLHPARALSDGTLRFLALAVIELDPEFHGVLCLEEPENGIHPARIPAMLSLLQDIAVDASSPIGTDNPLRQVIVNTHSPTVVAQVPEDCLVMAEAQSVTREGQTFKKLSFSCLPKTWRAATQEMDLISKGELLSYLNPVLSEAEELSLSSDKTPIPKRRVIDREEIQLGLGFGG